MRGAASARARRRPRVRRFRFVAPRPPCRTAREPRPPMAARHPLPRLVAGALVVGADVGERLAGRRRSIEGDDLDAGPQGLMDDGNQARVVVGRDGDAVHPPGNEVLDDLHLQRDVETGRRVDLGLDAVAPCRLVETPVHRLEVGVHALGHHDEYQSARRRAAAACSGLSAWHSGSRGWRSRAPAANRDGERRRGSRTENIAAALFIQQNDMHEPSQPGTRFVYMRKCFG